MFASSEAGSAVGARARADRLVTFTSLGRLVVAPAGIPAGLRSCLEGALESALGDPGFRTAAARSNRPLEVTPAGRMRRELDAASAALTDLLPVIERAARRAR